MTSLPLTRDEALKLIHKYNKDKSDINHYLESEAIMGALANRLGEDIEYWRMIGLLHDIDWGIIQPGSIVNVTVFVKNEGNRAISLNITAEDWSPVEATSYMTFSSNYVGQTIDVREILQVTLSLTTSLNIEDITSFSFDISVDINPV